MIDSSIYDLSTPDGQQQAIQDIIDEGNDQFDKSRELIGYNVVAYTELTVTLINGSGTGVYTTKYLHGLGFPPQVMGFFEQPGGQNFFAPMPYDEIQFIPGGLTNTYQYYTVDNQFLYFNVYGRDLGGFFSTNNFQAGFYIFDLPLNI